MEKVFKNDVERPKVILVTGPPGSMKTTFCYSVMSQYLKDKNEFGLYATLEETVDSHLKNMESMGVKLSMKMQISDLTDLREIDQIDEVIGQEAQTDYVLFIEKMIQRFRRTHGNKFSIFVLDSLGALYSLMENVSDMRRKMFYFFKMLRDNNLICFIIMERSLSGESQQLGNEGFLADGILLLGLDPGTRVVTFAPILKQRGLPLGEILTAIQEEGARGMGTAMEIEFAVDLGCEIAEFGIVQMRPPALSSFRETMMLGAVDKSDSVCYSARVLGNGRLDVLRDVVYVDFHRFDRAQSRDVAAEIARLNGRLLGERRPYLLIGVGRWGSRDPWLGIPVTWDQVAGARVIVEAGLRDANVTPSQGSHFFQNLTAFEVGYFTIGESGDDGFVDWQWLAARPAKSNRCAVRHLRFAQPLVVRMDGHRGAGVVLKPGREVEA